MLAALNPSYPAATLISILVGAFAARARIQQAIWFGDHYIRNYCFLFSQNHTTRYSFLRSLYPHLLLIIYSLNMFLHWLRWRGLSQCPFWGQCHPTQQVNCLQVCCWLTAICIMLSVSAELLKFWIRNKFLWIAFSAASLVEILLVVSYPVSAWSAGRHRVSLSPSAVDISWSGNFDLFIPETQLPTWGNWWQDDVPCTGYFKSPVRNYIHDTVTGWHRCLCVSVIS